MNENLLGKKLKHRDALDTEAAKVIRVGENWVDFDNKTSVLKEKIKDNFVEIEGKINDAEAFLENTAMMAGLMSKIVSGQKGGVSIPDGDNMSMRNNAPSVELSTESHAMEMDETQLLSAAKAAREEQAARNIKARMEQEEWAREQGILDDDGGEQIVIDAASYLKEKTPLAGQAAADAAAFGAVGTGRQSAPLRAQVPVNPVAGIFESMKRPKQIKIRFEVSEMIPKLESIKSFEDMFSFDIVETLSIEITDRIMKNPRIIEEAIKKQLEMLIRPKKKKKVVAPVTKKKPATKTEEDDTTNDE